VAAPEEAPAPPPALPSQAKPSGSAEIAGPNVTDEVRYLDTARAELGRGRPAQAIAALDLYEQQFGAGVLRPEADLVRLQAYARLGDKSTVSARARAFLAKYPSSPHAPQVRALLGQAEPPRPAPPSVSARPSSVASFPVGG
jgi:outer membrane protein assembly factor BamD (BamD/ComL family)